MELPREGRRRIVVNMTGLTAAPQRLAQVQPVGEIVRDGLPVVEVWECDNIGLANMQAELLWEAGYPARIVAGATEERAFVRSLMGTP